MKHNDVDKIKQQNLIIKVDFQQFLIKTKLKIFKFN